MEEIWSEYPENEIPRAYYAHYNGIWYNVIVDRLPIFYLYRKIVRNNKEIGTIYVCDSKRAELNKDSNDELFWNIKGDRSLSPVSYSKPYVSHLSKQNIFSKL